MNLPASARSTRAKTGNHFFFLSVSRFARLHPRVGTPQMSPTLEFIGHSSWSKITQQLKEFFISGYALTCLCDLLESAL